MGTVFFFLFKQGGNHTGLLCDFFLITLFRNVAALSKADLDGYKMMAHNKNPNGEYDRSIQNVTL